MTPFEHTVLICLRMHTRLGERTGVFLHTPTLNALPRRVYIDGRLAPPTHPFYPKDPA